MRITYKSVLSGILASIHHEIPNILSWFLPANVPHTRLSKLITQRELHLVKPRKGFTGINKECGKSSRRAVGADGGLLCVQCFSTTMQRCNNLLLLHDKMDEAKLSNLLLLQDKMEGPELSNLVLLHDKMEGAELSNLLLIQDKMEGAELSNLLLIQDKMDGAELSNLLLLQDKMEGAELSYLILL